MSSEGTASYSLLIKGEEEEERNRSLLFPEIKIVFWDFFLNILTMEDDIWRGKLSPRAKLRDKNTLSPS